VFGVSVFEVSVLGPVRLLLDGRDRTPGGALQRRLLCALALRSTVAAPAGDLADLLWPEGLPADHRAALQTHVFRLRRLLPEGAIATTPGGSYRLDLGPEALDAARFEALVYDAAALRATDPEAAVARLDEALGWWRGTPYDELAEVDDARIEAARLAELAVRAREERFDGLLDLGRHHEVLADLEALAAHEPLRERPQGLLMVALHRSGRRADALAVHDRFRRALATELGIDPSAALRDLHDAIVTDEVQAAAAPSSPRARTGEVPRFTSSFVGRDDLVAEVVRRLEDERLVTLVGTGGIGKTRVAVEVARAAGPEAGGEVWFCELAAADRTSVVMTVAGATGVDLRAGVGLLERIVELLRDRRGLLVLDNCEHVLDAVAEVAEAVLAKAPAVRVLATSRERLAVDGEHLFPVPLLPRPAAGPDEPAVRLFVDRARAVQPAWSPAEEEVALIAELCGRLDGLPLAIELAAARLHTLTLDEVASGLETRFRLLTGGRRTTARHRSLAAAVGWSYDLLGPREQELFDAVALFQSSFRAAAAGDLVGWDAADATDVLSRLVERSLLHRTGARYGMLESLRHFGAARLDERGLTGEVRRRHADHHVAFAEASWERLHRPGQVDVFAELDASLPDLRATQRYLLDAGDHDGLLRLCLALRDYGYYRLRPEVLRWAAAAADLAEQAGGDSRSAEALAIAGHEAWHRGEHDRGLELARRGRALVEASGEQPGFYLLAILGFQALHRGHLAESVEWSDVAYRSEVGRHDVVHRMEAQGGRALVRSYAGDPRTAGDVAELLAALDDDTPEVAAAWAWYVAGESVVHDDPPLAAERLGRAMDLARRCGASFLLGIAGASAASIEARYGDPAEAVAQYRWLLDHWQRAGIRVIQWNMLRAVDELLVRTGSLRAAAVLLGALTSTEEGHAVFGEDAQLLAAIADAVRQGLDRDEHDAALAEGRRLDDDGAVAVALAAFDAL